MAWPIAARAQRAGGMPKVGLLLAVAEDEPEGQARMVAFRQGLEDLGWKDGQNIHLEYRWSAGKSELIRQYAEELVALAPSVIIANGTPSVVALKSITKSIPIVFALTIDPVGLGHVKSLSHPGGNITGFTFINPELIGKWIGLLKDGVPSISRAALLCSPSNSACCGSTCSHWRSPSISAERIVVKMLSPIIEAESDDLAVLAPDEEAILVAHPVPEAAEIFLGQFLEMQV